MNMQAGSLIRRLPLELAALATFKEVLAYVLKKQHYERPGVSLRLVCQCPKDKRLALTPGFELILNALEDSLPVLVGLEVYIPSFFCTTLYDALRKPAPRLRRLGLGQGRDESPAFLPPVDLFNGSAHHLHSICLAFPTLPADWRPPTVFQRVTHAQLTLYRAGHPVPISRVLPDLSSLDLDLEHNDPDWSPMEVDLSGLQLDRLVLADVPGPQAIICGIDIQDIPVFGRTVVRSVDRSLWNGKGAPLTIPLCGTIMSQKDRTITFWKVEREPLLSITPTTGGWTRTATMRRDWDEPLCLIQAIATIPHVNSRLVALIIDQVYLGPFLSCWGTMLSVLDLYICVTGRDSGIHGLSPGEAQLTFPALRKVTLLSLGDIEWVRVDYVALLGQILKQAMRPTHSRASLDMMRVAFVRPCKYELVNAVFSEIREYLSLDPNVRRLADTSSGQIQTTFHVPNWVYH